MTGVDNVNSKAYGRDMGTTQAERLTNMIARNRAHVAEIIAMCDAGAYPEGYSPITAIADCVRNNVMLERALERINLRDADAHHRANMSHLSSLPWSGNRR